jgi:hypothetical protein
MIWLISFYIDFSVQDASKSVPVPEKILCFPGQGHTIFLSTVKTVFGYRSSGVNI